MDGVSDWGVNAITLVKGDGKLSADEKRTLQRFLQISQERRMMSHAMASFSMMMSSSKKPTTTMMKTTMMKTTQHPHSRASQPHHWLRGTPALARALSPAA